MRRTMAALCLRCMYFLPAVIWLSEHAPTPYPRSHIINCVFRSLLGVEGLGDDRRLKWNSLRDLEYDRTMQTVCSTNIHNLRPMSPSHGIPHIFLTHSSILRYRTYHLHTTTFGLNMVHTHTHTATVPDQAPPCLPCPHSLPCPPPLPFIMFPCPRKTKWRL